MNAQNLVWLWWTITIVVMLTGLVGTFLPILPGSILIVAGAIFHHYMFPPEQSVDWWTLSGLILLAAVSAIIDFVSGTVGAKQFGATKYGTIGGVIGAIVGLAFGLPGLILGPVLGVLLGELIAGKELLGAGKSTFGTVVGTAAGMAGKLGIAIIMVVWFLIAALWIR